jgi:ribosomal protein L37AE/L43A
MKEKLECPKCTSTNHERIGPGAYVCNCCSKTFTVPKGLRSA